MSRWLEKAGLALVSVLLAVTVYHAVEPEMPAAPEAPVQQVSTLVNSNENGELDLVPEQTRSVESTESTDSNDYISAEEAAERLRDALLNREQKFKVKVISDLDLCDKDVFRTHLYYPAFSEELSDVSPFAGKYLYRNVSGGSYRLRSDDSRHWEVEFTDFTYAIPAGQSAEFEKRVYDIICEMGIRNQSDYNKCLAIYNYITANVRYDYDTLNSYREGVTTGRELGYTAYAALMQGRAVCAGYAQLFYVMCKAADLPVRIIDGEGYSGNEWEAHSWNAVEIEGVWYQVDCTWDEGQTMNQWAFFLKGTDFPWHRVTCEMPAGVFVSNEDYPLPEYTLGM